MASGINVGGTWKDITTASVNVGGTWKTVSNIHINVGGTWKEAWAAGGGAWTPASLFASSEVGAWYDPSDLTTMWTDDGTTQAGVNDLVYRIDDKSGNGNHARQATESRRPVLRQSGSLYYLEFDGVDDSLNTDSFSLGTAEATLALGINGADLQTAEAIAGIATGATTANSFSLRGGVTANEIEILSRGTSTGGTAVASVSPNTDYVVTSLIDQTVPTYSIRVNGALQNTGGTGLGSGFATLPFQLGARSSTSLPFQGRIYNVVLRSVESSGDDLTNLESYLADKAGVTL